MSTLTRDITASGRVKSLDPDGQSSNLVIRFEDETEPVFLVPRDMGRMVLPGAMVLLEGILRKPGLVFVQRVSPLSAWNE